MQENRPVMPVSAAAGDLKKSLIAPYDCTVKKLMDVHTALSVDAGAPLMIVEGNQTEELLRAPAAGLIVYIPAKEGMSFKTGEPLLLLL